MLTDLLKGKKGLIMGVANNRSIAWGVAQAAREAGAELGFTYVGEALERRVRPLAESVDSDLVVECDVTDDASIKAAFKHVTEKWGKIDFLVHAIAFADKTDLQGRFVETSRKGFSLAMDVSAYSLLAVSRAALPLMREGGNILTFSYYGAEKVVPNYNMMGVAKAALEASVRYMAADLGPDGIRVNAISAGPIKTLAASGIGDFKKMITYNEANSPMRQNITQEDVGKTSLWLLSELSSGVTGEIVYVDSGYHVMGSTVSLGE